MNPSRDISYKSSGLLFWTIIYTITLAFLLAIVFLPLTTYGFISYDETYQVRDNPLIRSLSIDNVKRIFTSFCIRSYYPIRVLSFAADYHFWGLNPIGYHLTNLLLHILNTLLVFWLVFRLIGDVETGLDDRAETCVPPGKNPDHRLASAAAAACIFGIHPVVVEVVAWVGAREELLMTLFALLCIHCWTHAKQLQQSRRTRGAVLFYVLSVIFCTFSCLSNAMGILIPAIIVAYEKTLGRTQTFRHSLRSTWLFWLVAFAAFVLKLMSRTLVMESRTPANPFTRIVHLRPIGWNKLLVTLDRFGENLMTVIWPDKLTILYPNWIPHSFLSIDVILGLAGLLAIIALFVVFRRLKLVMFGMLWFLIAMAPSCQIVHGIIGRGDRFMYFPLSGLAPVIGYATYVFAKHSRAGMKIAIVSAAIILCTLSFTTINQLKTWRNSLTAFGHAAELNPISNVPHLVVGRMLLQLQDIDHALWHLEMAERIDPNCADTRFALGWALAHKGDNLEAIEHLEQGLRLDPYNNRIRELIKSLYEIEGVPKEKRRFLETQIVPLKAENLKGRSSYYPFRVVWRDFLAWIKQKTTGKEPVQPAETTQSSVAVGAD